MPRTNMSLSRITTMDTSFDPAAYHNEYQDKLRQLIEAKIAGKEITAAPEAPNNVIILMDALEGSIKQAQSGPKKQDTEIKGA